MAATPTSLGSGGSVTLQDVDLEETGARNEEGTTATAEAASCDSGVERERGEDDPHELNHHASSHLVSTESYFSQRWSAFRRKALVRRTARMKQHAGTPLTQPQLEIEERVTSNGSSEEGEAGGMKKVLGAGDLIMFGIGGIVGAGVFVLTGVGAHDAAGPAIIVSYLIASFAAGLSALCYTEFAVDMPVAGGAFNYVAMECGEVFGWISGWNLVLEYTLSSAAVGRGFSSYASTMFGLEPDSWRISLGVLSLDFPGLLVVFAITALLCYGTKESANFNIVITVINIVVILFVVFAGCPEISLSDFKPFAPKGITGIFNGAAIVFFSYVGFDTVATTAEETRNPSRDLPIGIVGSLAVCTVLYAAMCASLTGMVYYEDIDVNAPFADAFQRIGMGWATEIVSIGAVTGIITALLVSLLGCARIYTILGRTGLLPPLMSRISKSRGTPIHATVVTGLSAGLLTFFFDIEVLAELVSIGTLFVFSVVAGSILIKHYRKDEGIGTNVPYIVIRITLQVVLSITLSIAVMKEKWAVVGVLGVMFLAVAFSFYAIPRNQLVLKFRVPLIPLVPSLCILFNVYLIASLGIWAYVRFFVWNFIGLSVYFFYGVIHTDEPQVEKSVVMTKLNHTGAGIKRDSLREDAVLLTAAERSA